MPRIKVISHSEATGRLKEIYDGLEVSRGKLANVHTIQSLRPESITHHMNMYMETMFSQSELSRAERELIGTVVSVATGCSYCARHHGEALNHYWKNRDRMTTLLGGTLPAGLSEREATLCAFAKHLTLYPARHESEDHTLGLKASGLSDAAVLDAVLVIGYFNFVNRIVLSLGVELEADSGTGYKYD